MNHKPQSLVGLPKYIVTGYGFGGLEVLTFEGLQKRRFFPDLKKRVYSLLVLGLFLWSLDIFFFPKKS